MSRQINLLGIVGEPGQDGSYDIQVRTTDGLPVGTFKVDASGQAKPISGYAPAYWLMDFHEITTAHIYDITINGESVLDAFENITVFIAKEGDEIEITLGEGYEFNTEDCYGMEDSGLEFESSTVVSGTLVSGGGNIAFHDNETI